MKNDCISETILRGAFTILTEWERTSATLDDCLDRLRAAGRVPGAPATASLLFEYFRHKSFIDTLILARAKKGGVKEGPRALLACALAQTIFQTGIAPQSAVNVAVECAKQQFGRGPAAFVNAVLRAVLRSDEIKSPPPYSFPEGLRRRWEKIFDAATVAQMISGYASNPPPVFRARGVLPEIENAPAIYRALPTLDFTAPFRFYEILNPREFFRLDWLDRGLAYVQDPATVLALSLLNSPPEGATLDACAAPGGKTILLHDRAKEANHSLDLTAIDRSPRRLAALKTNLAHANVPARVLTASAQDNPFPDASFKLILADVPCTNNGVLRRRCDAPWRFSLKKLRDAATLQHDILNSLARLAALGGKILYSTCSVEPEEDEFQTARFLAEHTDFRLIRQRKIFPCAVHDGAFAALLARR